MGRPTGAAIAESESLEAGVCTSRNLVESLFKKAGAEGAVRSGEGKE